MNHLTAITILLLLAGLCLPATVLAETAVYVDSYGDEHTRINADEFFELTPAEEPAAQPLPAPALPPSSAAQQQTAGNPQARTQNVQPADKNVQAYIIFRYMAGSLAVKKHELEVRTSFANHSLAKKTVKLDDGKTSGNSYSLAFGFMADQGIFSCFRPEFEILVNNYGAIESSGSYDFRLNNGTTETRRIDSKIEFTSSVTGMLNLWFDIPLGLRIKPYIGASLGGGVASYDYTLDINSPGTTIPRYTRSEDAFIVFGGAGVGFYTVLFDRIMLDCYARYLWSDTRGAEMDSSSIYSYNPKFRTPLHGAGLSLGILF